MGSHKQFRHADGRCTTVPFHKGRDVSPILLRQIARDIQITAEELVDACQASHRDRVLSQSAGSHERASSGRDSGS